jgi:hypothetical protein
MCSLILKLFGEVAQTMHTHVSKCKNNKIKKLKYVKYKYRIVIILLEKGLIDECLGIAIKTQLNI